MTTKTINNPFNKTQKEAKKVGEEIRNNGLVWRRTTTDSKDNKVRGTYKFDFEVKGHHYRGSIGKDADITQSAAEKYVADLKAEIRCGKITSKNKSKHEFLKCANDYLDNVAAINTVDSYPSILSRVNKHLIPYFENIMIEDILPADIQDCLAVMKTNKRAASTINKVHTDLSGIYERAKLKKIEVSNPMNEVPREPSKDTNEDIKIFEEHELHLMEERAKKLGINDLPPDLVPQLG